MIKGLHHVAISTGNLKRLSDFYCNALGFQKFMEAEWHPGTALGELSDTIIGLKNSAAKMEMVKKDGIIIELFEYISPVPKPVASDWRVCDHGYTHICLEVQDLEAEYERLRKAGMTFHVPPPSGDFKGFKGVYGRDPEGNVIELLEAPPAQ